MPSFEHNPCQIVYSLLSFEETRVILQDLNFKKKLLKLIETQQKYKWPHDTGKKSFIIEDNGNY